MSGSLQAVIYASKNKRNLYTATVILPFALGVVIFIGSLIRCLLKQLELAIIGTSHSEQFPSLMSLILVPPMLQYYLRDGINNFNQTRHHLSDLDEIIVLDCADKLQKIFDKKNKKAKEYTDIAQKLVAAEAVNMIHSIDKLAIGENPETIRVFNDVTAPLPFLRFILPSQANHINSCLINNFHPTLPAAPYIAMKLTDAQRQECTKISAALEKVAPKANRKKIYIPH